MFVIFFTQQQLLSKAQKWHTNVVKASIRNLDPLTRLMNLDHMGSMGFRLRNLDPLAVQAYEPGPHGVHGVQTHEPGPHGIQVLNLVDF